MSATQREGTEQRVWPGAIAAITLFVEDLEAAKRFYREVFELPVAFEDDNSAVSSFGDTMVNLLKLSEAPGLVEPATVATRDAGVRFQFTLDVGDVDAMCEELKERGVELLNGPMDRRTHLGDRPLATRVGNHRLGQRSHSPPTRLAGQERPAAFLA